MFGVITCAARGEIAVVVVVVVCGVCVCVRGGWVGGGGVWCGARYLVVAAEPVLLLDEIHQRVVQSGAVRQEETRAGRDGVEEEEALRKHPREATRSGVHAAR